MRLKLRQPAAKTPCKCGSRGGIYKHRGMHSLRHTMASVLLEKDTPLPVISDIIGHLDTNSTAVYLKVDMARLAECPLDFKEVISLG